MSKSVDNIIYDFGRTQQQNRMLELFKIALEKETDLDEVLISITFDSKYIIEPEMERESIDLMSESIMNERYYRQGEEIKSTLMNQKILNAVNDYWKREPNVTFVSAIEYILLTGV